MPLQLAGVSAISEAVWEMGTLVVNEKASPARRGQDALLVTEFNDFSEKRLIVGRGICHRSGVIGAFQLYKNMDNLEN